MRPKGDHNFFACIHWIVIHKGKGGRYILKCSQQGLQYIWMPLTATEQIVSDAKRLCETGNYVGAIEMVTMGLTPPELADGKDCDPLGENDIIRLLLLRAHMRLKQGDCHEALKDSKAILKLRDGVKHAYMVQGEAYMLLNQFTKASETFLAGLKLFPSDLILEQMFKNSVQGVRQKWHQYNNAVGHKLIERDLTEHLDLTKETSTMKVLRRANNAQVISDFTRRAEKAKKEAGASLDILEVVRQEFKADFKAAGGMKAEMSAKEQERLAYCVSECNRATISILLDFRPVLETIFKFFCLDPTVRQSKEPLEDYIPPERRSKHECIETLQAYLHHIYGLPKAHFIELLKETQIATDNFTLAEVHRSLENMGSTTAKLPSLLAVMDSNRRKSCKLPDLNSNSSKGGEDTNLRGLSQQGIPATLSFPKFLEALINVICARSKTASVGDFIFFVTTFDAHVYISFLFLFSRYCVAPTPKAPKPNARQQQETQIARGKGTPHDIHVRHFLLIDIFGTMSFDPFSISPLETFSCRKSAICDRCTHLEIRPKAVHE